MYQIKLEMYPDGAHTRTERDKEIHIKIVLLLLYMCVRESYTLFG